MAPRLEWLEHTGLAACAVSGVRNQIGRQLSIPLSRGLERFAPFWHRERHAARRPRLIARARAFAAVRGFFAAEDFVEVEPAALQISPGNETHLHGFRTELVDGGGGRRPFYLHTSPEFAMKKLLAAGETRIFAVTKVFRNRERSALHAPEFTMLEWYRVGEPPAALEADCAALIRIAAEAAGTRSFTFRGREADPFAAPERVSVRDAFLRHTGIDIFATMEALPEAARPLPPRGGGLGRGGGIHDTSGGFTPTPTLPHRGGGGVAARAQPAAARFAAEARAIGVRTAPDDSWSDVFSRLVSERVEPNLGVGRATILSDYPASEAALAKLSAADPRVAERFELFGCGVELANAFGELTDVQEQRRRFEADMALKAELYGESYPIDEDFLDALGVMPEASGAALGFDRLVMLATGAESIDDVQWTPVVDPEGFR